MSANPCLGVIRIGRLELAIPADELQQVVSEPLPISPLPEAPPFILGIVVLHHTPVPVVDLQQLLQPDLSITKPRPRLLVFLNIPQGRVAILADEVVKVTRPDARCFAEITSGCGTGAGLFKQVFIDAATVVSVLSISALAQLPGVRFAVAPAVSPASANIAAGPAAMRTLFRIGSLTFALAIEATARAMMVPPLIGDDLPSSFLRGFFTLAGKQTALIDLLRLLDLPQPASADVLERMMVIEHAGRAIAFGISGIAGIESHSENQLQPLVASGLRQAELYLGAIHSRHCGKVLVLDHEKLLAHPNVRSLLAIRDSVQAISRNQSDSSESSHANFIIYRAGESTLASAILQLEAAVQCPEELTHLRVGSQPFVGFFTWQEHVVPLIDLGSLLGAPLLAPLPPSARVLIVRVHQELRGYLVHRVDSLQAGIPKILPWTAASRSQQQQLTDRFPAFTHMLTVTSDTTRRNASILDLTAIEIAKCENDTAEVSAPELVAV